MCRLRNIALESVTEKCDRRTDRQTDRRTDRRTDDGQSDPYLSLCFTGDTKIIIMHCIYRVQSWQCTEQFGLYDVHKVTYILVQYESWPLTLKINRLIRQHIFEVLSNSPIGFVCSVNKIISMFVYCDIDLSPLTLQMKKGHPLFIVKCVQNLMRMHVTD